MIYPKTDRQWRSMTGFDERRFEILVKLFEQGYVAVFGRSLAERVADCPETMRFTEYRSLLFFTLVSLKNELTYDCLGYMFGIDGSNAKRNQTLGLQVLKRSLADADLLPARSFDSPEAFWAHFSAQKTLIIDGTEQRVQRPKEGVNQQDFYSGKKKDIR